MQREHFLAANLCKCVKFQLFKFSWSQLRLSHVLFDRMIKLDANDVVVCDRGFYSYETLNAHALHAVRCESSLYHLSLPDSLELVSESFATI